MKIEKIYFDMDGVLADFPKGVKAMCGIEPLDQDHHTPEYDELMYAKMRNVDHFYRKLDAYEPAVKLFLKVREQYGSKVEILTGIPRPSRGITQAEEDKREWIKSRFGDDIVVNVCLRKEKINYCFGKGCILIDDFVRNIKEWEKAGGTGILYKNAVDAAAKLEKLAATE